jgi:hypothetical protein
MVHSLLVAPASELWQPGGGGPSSSQDGHVPASTALAGEPAPRTPLRVDGSPAPSRCPERCFASTVPPRLAVIRSGAWSPPPTAMAPALHAPASHPPPRWSSPPPVVTGVGHEIGGGWRDWWGRRRDWGFLSLTAAIFSLGECVSVVRTAGWGRNKGEVVFAKWLVRHFFRIGGSTYYWIFSKFSE